MKILDELKKELSDDIERKIETDKKFRDDLHALKGKIGMCFELLRLSIEKGAPVEHTKEIINLIRIKIIRDCVESAIFDEMVTICLYKMARYEVELDELRTQIKELSNPLMTKDD